MEPIRRAGVEWGESAEPDEELVRRVRAGALAVFSELVRRHAGRVHRAVRSILRDDAEVEDAVQQTFLQAFVALARFEGASSFSTWLTRIALNEAMGRVRRRWAVIDSAFDPDAAASPVPGPEREAAAREALALVRRAVHRLPPGHREVFRLRHVEGLSTTQAAARLGITESAVKIRLHRARRFLGAATGTGRPAR